MSLERYEPVDALDEKDQVEYVDAMQDDELAGVDIFEGMYESTEKIEETEQELDKKTNQLNEYSEASSQSEEAKESVYSKTGDELFAFQDQVYAEVYGETIDRHFSNEMYSDHYDPQGELIEMNTNSV